MNPTNPSSNDITRRSFMKKSSLAIGAITLLSRGIALAEDEETGPYAGIFKCKKKCDNDPTFVKYGMGIDTSDVAINPSPIVYFKVVTCKCKGGHTMGEFRTSTQEKPFTFETHSSYDPIPKEHTQDHGPCNQ